MELKINDIMNSEDIIKHITGSSTITPFRARRILRDIFELMSSTLMEGDTVHLKGIGKLEVVKQKNQKRFDPTKNQAIMVSNAKRLKFSPSRTFKENLNKNKKVKYLKEPKKGTKK